MHEHLGGLARRHREALSVAADLDRTEWQECVLRTGGSGSRRLRLCVVLTQGAFGDERSRGNQESVWHADEPVRELWVSFLEGNAAPKVFLPHGLGGVGTKVDTYEMFHALVSVLAWSDEPQRTTVAMAEGLAVQMGCQEHVIRDRVIPHEGRAPVIASSRDERR